jgi:hypothetical protein
MANNEFYASKYVLIIVVKVFEQFNLAKSWPFMKAKLNNLHKVRLFFSQYYLI